MQEHSTGEIMQPTVYRAVLQPKATAKNITDNHVSSIFLAKDNIEAIDWTQMSS